MLMRNAFLFLLRSLNAVAVMSCKTHERMELQCLLVWRSVSGKNHPGNLSFLFA
ncbi:hypothetical protein 2011_scaffold3_00022 [Bacteriophage sp.]|nr:hypothetical protein 2011_scaffold3_00022 [Bacteriophage sp.]